mmetsp:Transcript_2444/g.5600  ORF Transcript_2444/g.5600 Transcript_2444/m.5600 type:complete len:87 (-) Transcript_2444:41-301(-)
MDFKDKDLFLRRSLSSSSSRLEKKTGAFVPSRSALHSLPVDMGKVVIEIMFVSKIDNIFRIHVEIMNYPFDELLIGDGRRRSVIRV